MADSYLYTKDRRITEMLLCENNRGKTYPFWNAKSQPQSEKWKKYEPLPVKDTFNQET